MVGCFGQGLYADKRIAMLTQQPRYGYHPCHQTFQISLQFIFHILASSHMSHNYFHDNINTVDEFLALDQRCFSSGSEMF